MERGAVQVGDVRTPALTGIGGRARAKMARQVKVGTRKGAVEDEVDMEVGGQGGCRASRCAQPPPPTPPPSDCVNTTAEG